MDFYRAFTWRARGVGNCVCYNFTVELHQVFFQNLEQMGDRKKERKKNTHTKMGGGGISSCFLWAGRERLINPVRLGDGHFLWERREFPHGAIYLHDRAAKGQRINPPPPPLSLSLSSTHNIFFSND